MLFVVDLSGRHTNGTTLQLAVQSMLDDLAFEPGQERVEAAEAAMRNLDRRLGFAATRPEKETTKGPDGCWGLTPTTNAAIEAQDGHRTRRHRHHQVRDRPACRRCRLGRRGERLRRMRPGPRRQERPLHKLASAPPGTRVITPETLTNLKNNIRAFAAEIAIDRTWERPEAVAAALQRNDLTADRIIPKHSRKVEPAGN